MNTIALSPAQREIAHQPVHQRIFLEGDPGSGKTTTGIARLQFLLEQGVPGEQILILLPQRTLAQPYYQFINQPGFPPGGLPGVVTLGGLAQRAVQLFWPAIGEEIGFTHPQQPPSFLTLETAQYYMARVVEPYLDRGYFEQLVIDRNRLYSQLIDNLNKAAVVSISLVDIGERLKRAWGGQASQLILFDQAQECINAFRSYCFENNLLDYSLQIEVFTNHLWPSFLVRNYLQTTFRHLIYDNTEEDVPVAHDLIRDWLPAFESALLIYDYGGGHRLFLGADSQSGYALRQNCEKIVELPGSQVTSQPVAEFGSVLCKAIRRELREEQITPNARQAFTHLAARFYTQMIEQVCDQIDRLVNAEGVSPAEIVVLSPFVSDALRHSLMNQLTYRNVPVRSHRPSRSLYDEPAARSLLTAARLAHPHWKIMPSREEVRSMLLHFIAGLDLVRADLLVHMLYRPNAKDLPLLPFEGIQQHQMQERITYSAGNAYAKLRDWMANYLDQGEEMELDIFYAFLFGEILSQPAFGFHQDFDAAAVTARLIESIQKFRRVIEPTFLEQQQGSIGLEYLRMVRQGVIAAQHIPPIDESNAVLIAPAYTFIISNRPVSYQFWMDVGSLGWWQRLYQPLTHPYVLSRHWIPGTVWSDMEEHNANQNSLARLIRGLAARCQEHIYLCSARVNERGAEERSALLQAFQALLRRLRIQEKRDG